MHASHRHTRTCACTHSDMHIQEYPPPHTHTGPICCRRPRHISSLPPLGQPRPRPSPPPRCVCPHLMVRLTSHWPGFSCWLCSLLSAGQRFRKAQQECLETRIYMPQSSIAYVFHRPNLPAEIEQRGQCQQPTCPPATLRPPCIPSNTQDHHHTGLCVPEMMSPIMEHQAHTGPPPHRAVCA